MKSNKNLREHRKNRNCLSESKSCKYGTRFQGQLRFPRQAGDVPQPCRTIYNRFSQDKPQATEKFFDPAIFQKCWRGSGRVALIAARRQRNPRAMLLAHGGGGEKSDSFSRRGEQDRPALFPRSSKQQSCNCSGGTVTTEIPYRKSCS